jgi:hypothetical protein
MTVTLSKPGTEGKSGWRKKTLSRPQEPSANFGRAIKEQGKQNSKL